MQFADQVETLAKWFKDWDECEQTVALYSLLKRVKKCQAKFLCQCLKHFLTDCSELTLLEDEANDTGYICNLLSVASKAEVIQILLSHLPLLQPGNETAKNSYLMVLPTVLGYAIERSEYLEESRQLLSYSLIHPAFDNVERNMLTSWMSGLDGPPNNQHKPPLGEASPETMSASNSLETGVKLSDWNHNEDFSSSKDFSNHNQMASVPPIVPLIDKPLLPIPGNASNSETPVPDGMADVKSWLKSLRLHKYADIFTTMTYDDMMNLTPDGLAAQNVTKGARDKIILNIRKLHERFAQLQSLDEEILVSSLRSALHELKAIIQTPIRCFNAGGRSFPAVDVRGPGRREAVEDGDIPSLFTKVMGKACTQLLVTRPDEDNIKLYMKLLERCLNHQAFTEQHKRRLSSWKQQVNKMYRSLPRNSRPPQSRSQPNVGYPGLRRLPRTQFNPQAHVPTPRPMNPVSPPMRAVTMFAPQNQLNWYPVSPLAQTSSNDTARKTASLGPRLGQRYQAHDDDSANSDIDSLGTLCKSVAESALSDNLDGTSTL